MGSLPTMKLPNGQITKSTKAYTDTWFRLGEAVAKHFFAGFTVYGVDPGLHLYANSLHSHAIQLDLTTVRSLLMSPAAYSMPDREALVGLLPPLVRPRPVRTYKHMGDVQNLKVGDTIFQKAWDGNGMPRWFQVKVESLFRQPDGFVEGVFWKHEADGGSGRRCPLSEYGMSWSVHPEDWFDPHTSPADGAKAKPFKVSKGPIPANFQ